MNGRIRIGMRLALLAAVFLAPATLWAAAPSTTPDAAMDSDSHRASMPVLSSVDAWVGVMAIVILAMFAMAAVIGPVARVNMPPEVADTTGHGHDDSHGHGDAHGHDDGHGHADGHGSGGGSHGH
jgi:ABC-type nickel/cobalt efflux system permease component RcnA